MHSVAHLEYQITKSPTPLVGNHSELQHPDPEPITPCSLLLRLEQTWVVMIGAQSEKGLFASADIRTHDITHEQQSLTRRLTRLVHPVQLRIKRTTENS